jgi:hypothetical protein
MLNYFIERIVVITLKIDLLMWTLNGADTIVDVLNRINSVIPSECVNQKIIVDGGSDDNTVFLARSCGWTVYETNLHSISKQANFGLELIETEFFATFEQDLFLSENWFVNVSSNITKNTRIACVQGVRYSVHKGLNVLEREAVSRLGPCYHSVDNNLFRTSLLRSFGGFVSSNVVFSMDTLTKKRIEDNHFLWLVLSDVESVHLKYSLVNQAEHFQKMKLDEHADGRVINRFYFDFAKFLASPFLALYFSYKARSLRYYFEFIYWFYKKFETHVKLWFDKR